jgi:hypothetical protein
MNRQSFLGGALGAAIGAVADTIEKQAADSCLARFPSGGMMLLAITNHRFLIFGQKKGCGLRPTYHYLSEYALDDIVDMRVSGGMSARTLRIKFADDGDLTLDLPRAQGDADGLPSAFRQAKHLVA